MAVIPLRVHRMKKKLEKMDEEISQLFNHNPDLRQIRETVISISSTLEAMRCNMAQAERLSEKILKETEESKEMITKLMNKK